MKTWTVLGYYPDNDQRFVDEVEAADPDAGLAAAAELFPEVTIIALLPGQQVDGLDFFMPEDSV